MNIAHILPYGAKFPLKKHNGRYEWVLRLATAQARQGHAITIYAGPSTYEIEGITWRSLPSNLDSKQANNTALFVEAFRNTQHQILHSHFDTLHYEVADLSTLPIVATQHWFPTEKIAASASIDKKHRVTTVPVTKYMAEIDSTLGIPASDVIYHGIDLVAFSLSVKPRSDRLLFVGRIAPHKGVREVMQYATSAGVSLDIVGKINAVDMEYWETITPLVDGTQIRYLGAKSQSEVAGLMSHAKAMVFLPQAIEAFGQTIIESQACGTPVILNDMGANSELVMDGTSGFIIHSQQDFAKAVVDVSGLDAHDCRMFAEHFDIRTMIHKYEKLYQRLI